MYIKNISLKNYRNYSELDLNINPNINIFYGKNAQGKTNILESIYVSSIGRSYRSNKDEELIKFNEDNLNTSISFYNQRDMKIDVSIDNKRKKIIKINDIKVTKLANMVGVIKTVIFAPNELDIIKGSPSKRRRFIDILISQISIKYIYDLNRYNKVLEQRNRLLKQIGLNNDNKKIELLEIWESELITLNVNICKIRQKYLQKIQEKAFVIHKKLTNCEENIEIKYISDIIDKDQQEIQKLYEEKRKKDIYVGYTSIGIHKDDINIMVNNQLVSIYGSQGQSRTALLSLKLSELEIIEEETGTKPILLLDDVMSELDKNRINNLIDSIKGTQVIITTTHIEDINELKESKQGQDIDVYYVENGSIVKQKK